jgi:cytochrome c oxidase cbb3-type subunit 3
MKTPRDEMLDHEYDGIREYDNPPPGWIMAILYATLVFSVGYWLVFHVFDRGLLPVARYEVEVARAAELQLARFAGQEPTDESLALMAQTPAGTVEGAQIFQQFCIACHNVDGSGNVGPNLTDAYWIHGGSPLQMLQTVTNGVPAKGMVAWGAQLGPSRVQKVVAFLVTLKGRNLPGKAPQGELEGAAAPAP